MHDWIDSLSLSWVVPLVLDSMMAVAMSVYDYFVGEGVLYALILGWVGFAIGLYLIKMYFPQNWLDFFGLTGGGQMFGDKTPSGFDIVYSVLKPMARALFAIVILLQIKPTFLTHYVVDPFLEFGSIYVGSMTKTILPEPPKSLAVCPKEVQKYLSKVSCEFLVQPIDEVSAINNKVIRRGFDFVNIGWVMIFTPGPSLGPGIMNLATGSLMVATFLSSNVFMALLIIQGIFDFCMALILYPFKVLIYVVNPKNKNAWVEPWESFNDVIDALQKLVIAMIGVAFILLINMSIVGVLFHFDVGTVFGFGQHSITWITAIMTFWIMKKVFEVTKEKLDGYAGKNIEELYNNVVASTKALSQNAYKTGKKAFDVLKKKMSK